MILFWIFFIPLLGGVAAWYAGRRVSALSLWAAAASLVAVLTLLVSLWGRATADHGGWLIEWSIPWLPPIGASLAFSLDGLALSLCTLTTILGLVALMLVREDDGPSPGLRRFLVLATVSSLLGVFLASDLILFFIFYEAMLIPVFALMLLGDHPNRVRASLRFFIFTQAGGLLMLVAIFALYILHGRATGEYTFAYGALLNTPMSETASRFIFLGFFLAFAVKLPLVPFHTWQADAYEAAPSETAVLLSGLMAKAAGYGLLRFAIPLAPAGALHFAPLAATLATCTVVYAAWMAYGQRDMKRIIAYSSASHLGLVALGAFAMNDVARSGAILQMFCHGISVAGLFIVADLVERGAKTRDIEALGGLWHRAPRFGAVAIVFAMATLGLPGLGNFAGEFLTLLGSWPAFPLATAIAATGAVLSAAYTLRLLQSIFFGPKPAEAGPGEAAAPVLALCAALIVILVWLGAYPRPFLDAARQAGPASSVAAATTTGEPQ